jgi:hypothetical protein
MAERRAVMHILHELGYVDEKALSVDPDTRESIALINNAIRESQL